MGSDSIAGSIWHRHSIAIAAPLLDYSPYYTTVPYWISLYTRMVYLYTVAAADCSLRCWYGRQQLAAVSTYRVVLPCYFSYFQYFSSRQ